MRSSPPATGWTADSSKLGKVYSILSDGFAPIRRKVDTDEAS